MKAWSMFVHSLRLVVDHIDVALRISLLLYLLQVAAQVHGHLVGAARWPRRRRGCPGR